jgi:hypothetical protein
MAALELQTAATLALSCNQYIEARILSTHQVSFPCYQVIMLVLLLVHTIFQSSFGDAVPSPSLELRDPCSYGEPIQTRSLWNIIWSFFSTIFLYTWVSLHPNISSTTERPALASSKGGYGNHSSSFRRTNFHYFFGHYSFQSISSRGRYNSISITVARKTMEQMDSHQPGS